MKSTFKWLGLILLLAILAAGTFIFFNRKKAMHIIVPQIGDVQNIKVNLLEDTAIIDVDVSILNKGLLHLHVDSLAYKVELDSTVMLERRDYLNLDLPKSSKDTLHLQLHLPYKQMSKKIKSLQGRDSVGIPVSLRLVYTTFMGTSVLPYAKNLRIEVPRPPKIEIEKIEFLKREKKTGYFKAYLRLHNYGKIQLNISDLNYKMEVKKLFIAQGKDDKEIHVQPQSSLAVELPIKIEFKHPLKTAVMIITDDDKVHYHLKVTAMVQNDKVSKSKTPLQVQKEGEMELKK